MSVRVLSSVHRGASCITISDRCSSIIVSYYMYTKYIVALSHIRSALLLSRSSTSCKQAHKYKTLYPCTQRIFLKNVGRRPSHNPAIHAAPLPTAHIHPPRPCPHPIIRLPVRAQPATAFFTAHRLATFQAQVQAPQQALYNHPTAPVPPAQRPVLGKAQWSGGGDQIGCCTRDWSLGRRRSGTCRHYYCYRSRSSRVLGYHEGGRAGRGEADGV